MYLKPYGSRILGYFLDLGTCLLSSDSHRIPHGGPVREVLLLPPTRCAPTAFNVLPRRTPPIFLPRRPLPAGRLPSAHLCFKAPLTSYNDFDSTSPHLTLSVVCGAARAAGERDPTNFGGAASVWERLTSIVFRSHCWFATYLCSS